MENTSITHVENLALPEPCSVKIVRIAYGGEFGDEQIHKPHVMLPVRYNLVVFLWLWRR